MKIKSEGKRGTRSIVICQNCGEEFSELNIKLRAGKGKFCCNECYNEFRRKNKRDVKESDRLYQKKCKYGLSKEDYKTFCIHHSHMKESLEILRKGTGSEKEKSRKRIEEVRTPEVIHLGASDKMRNS